MLVAAVLCHKEPALGVAKGGPMLPAKLRMMSVLNVLNIFKKILARISAFIWLNLIG